MLIDDYMQLCTFIDKVRTPDGEGGFTVEWRDGVQFDAAITQDSTMQAQIAQAQGVTSVYTITTHRNVVLEYHDVIRDSAGHIYRITTDGDEVKTPKSATIDIAQVKAEKWKLT